MLAETHEIHMLARDLEGHSRRHRRVAVAQLAVGMEAPEVDLRLCEAASWGEEEADQNPCVWREVMRLALSFKARVAMAAGLIAAPQASDLDHAPMRDAGAALVRRCLARG